MLEANKFNQNKYFQIYLIQQKKRERISSCGLMLLFASTSSSHIVGEQEAELGGRS